MLTQWPFAVFLLPAVDIIVFNGGPTNRLLLSSRSQILHQFQQFLQPRRTCGDVDWGGLFSVEVLGTRVIPHVGRDVEISTEQTPFITKDTQLSAAAAEPTVASLYAPDNVSDINIPE
ncbi:hypothetical protein CEP51_004325 [Fusarium floridanum]|uniref:Uncharacterized protein n=1 Tax=Fusarium floridanum TaxID=1325733 RepID=A0A428S1G6_9HYPO|nr:hypothetical protein CEP51_004325 [Fusarium floridanum]